VAAEALGLQSTGIGAFYDDLVHEYLGLKRGQGQVIYHFACGYAVDDDRLVVTVDDLLPVVADRLV
jgi:nitroreductase